MRDIEVGFYFEDTVDIDLEDYSEISGGYQFVVDFLTGFRDGEDEWFEDELYVNSEGDELYHLKFGDGDYVFGSYDDIEEAVEQELDEAMELPVS
ncbi:MAG: hypothetical protein ABEJ87_01615 [Candidatus Nanohalobium sp.]